MSYKIDDWLLYMVYVQHQDTEIYLSPGIVYRFVQIFISLQRVKMEKSAPKPYCGSRRLTDDLDDEVLGFVLQVAEASAGRIAIEIERPYSTVMVRCLKLEAAGLLHSIWYSNTRRFYLENAE
jgi:hypothetical protein